MSPLPKLFPQLPAEITTRLEQTYTEIVENFRCGKWEPSELNGGKFCETVIRLLEWQTSSPQSYTAFGTSIPDFGQSCRKFENLTAFSDSIRFHIPKLLNALYTVRNKRGVGHIAGEISPNHMDATLIATIADWIMAETIRIYHQVSLKEAQNLVESVIVRKIEVVWDVAGKHRVLIPKIPYEAKTLILLYKKHPDSVKESDLFEWIEHSNSSVYRRDVLRVAHGKKLIEYNEAKAELHLSPTGVLKAEKLILENRI